MGVGGGWGWVPLAPAKEKAGAASHPRSPRWPLTAWMKLTRFAGMGASVISLLGQDFCLGDLLVTSLARGGCCHFKNLLKGEPLSGFRSLM